MSSVNIYSEIPHEFSNMRSLRLLNLVKCNLFREFPSSVFLIPNLQSIALTSNPNLRGNLPVFRENNSLLELTIYETSFSGTIPDSIGNLIHLTSLILSNSMFSGKIPFSLGNLSHLSHLELSSNSFVGEIPSSISNLKQLTKFDVGDNKLGEILPASILNLTQVRYLSLSSNQFTSSLLSNISQLSKLETFDVDDNYFTGAILSYLLKIPSLTNIILDCNHSLFGIENISLLPNLQRIDIEHNNNNKVDPVDLNVFLPLKQLQRLYLSGIPLSTTNITSTSDFLSHLEDLFLRDCNITKFPEFIRNQSNLSCLDLSNNKIKGEVPDWLWRMPELEWVGLSNNSFNSFNGSFKSSPESKIYYLNLRSNAFQGPLFIPSRSLQYFVGSKNNFTGEIPRSICGLKSLEVLDVSNNNLHGSIPLCLETLMSSLSDLDLHKNRLSGCVPEIFINAKKLESLDLSQNKISGEIPPELGTLSSLACKNVSHNQLEGSIPQGTQFQQQKCSSYEGNPGIYGPSLKDVCGDKIALTQPQPETLVSKEEEEESLSWIEAGLGFAPGVVFGLSMGYIVTSYKHEWFMKIFGQRKQQSARAR